MSDTSSSLLAGRSSSEIGFWATGLFFVVILLIFHETTWSMIAIWLRSGTFAHGFLILPISLWLVWSIRDQLRPHSSVPVLWVALLIVPFGFLWSLGRLVDALVVQQLALVAILVVGAWAILGHNLARLILFPLLFLFLAVPMGEDLLVPPMMEFTAKSTVWLIQQTGIPVYREGMYFSLPSGHWSVVTACSGVRYIIASVTLGLIYAYLTYRSFSRRFLFMLAAILVPILANTGRAYMIVMLGHWSDMTVAVGVDHLIYGWVFFGVVIFLLFWLGSFFREDGDDSTDDGRASTENEQQERTISANLPAAAFLSLLLAAVWPWLTGAGEARRELSLISITLPDAVSDWSSADDAPWSWRPDNRVASETAGFYVRDGSTIGLYVQYPDGSEDSGEEIVGSSGDIGSKDGSMSKIKRDRMSIQLNGKAVVVDQALLRGAGGQLVAWSWYRIGEMYTSNDYLAKFHEALGVMGVVPAGSSRIVLSMPLKDSIDDTHAAMQDFLLVYGDSLDSKLNTAIVERRQ